MYTVIAIIYYHEPAVSQSWAKASHPPSICLYPVLYLASSPDVCRGRPAVAGLAYKQQYCIQTIVISLELTARAWAQGSFTLTSNLVVVLRRGSSGSAALGARLVCARAPLTEKQRALCRASPAAMAAIATGLRYDDCNIACSTCRYYQDPNFLEIWAS